MASIRFTLFCELYCGQCIVLKCITSIPTCMTVSFFFLRPCLLEFKLVVTLTYP